MKDLVGLAGSTHHLVVFELAARHRSFTAAARELNVTQQAVSRSVRTLEDTLGTSLFLRKHRRLEFTSAGLILHRGVSRGLASILEATRQVHRTTRCKVTICTTTPIASYWLVPQLPSFHAAHPEIELTFGIDEMDLVLTEPGTSLGIRWGNGSWSEYESCRIADEEIFPVASPDFARALTREDANRRLPDQTLIHIDETTLHATTWRRWFEELEIPYLDDGGGLRLNNDTAVLQAAIAGLGIALGWTLIVKRLIDQGQLARVGKRSWRSGRGLYVIWCNGTALTPNTRAVRDWIVSTARARMP